MSSVVGSAVLSEGEKIVNSIIQLALQPTGQALLHTYLIAHGVSSDDLAQLQANAASLKDPPDPKT